MTRRLSIDWTRCDGHGLCASLLPHRAHLDEWGFPVLRDAAVPAGAEDEAEVRHAVAACPALALYVEAQR